MLIFLLTSSLLVRHSRSSEVPTTAWFSAPNFRSTWDLLVSCVLTLTICVWSALHLNVPGENSTLTQRNLRRMRWIFLGIFAPELVVSTAFAQYLTAKWLRREILGDVKYRTAEEWSITQAYFAVMGGITVQAGDCVGNDPRLSLSPEGIRLLSFLGRLPEIKESQILDKSKADGLAKTIVCLQAGWMVIQTLARVIAGLPVTLLEINTIGHVMCALVLYLLWWSKPLEIKDPVLLPREDWMDPFLSLMWMCSPESSSNDDGISEMRCMAYTPPSQRDLLRIPTVRPPGVHDRAESDTALGRNETHFSVGSTGARNPRKFIGPLGDFQLGSQDDSITPMSHAHNVSYILSDKAATTAPEHEIFFQLQESHHALQHSRQYCRRAFPDCKERDPLSDFAVRRWRNANTLVDDLWLECEKRPSYMNYFFTTSTLGVFLGETSYLDTSISNFLGLSYLGSVNIHRDRLKSVLAVAGAAYGGLHVAAWNDYFPTEAERYVWITCSVAITTSGISLWLYFFAKEKIHALDVLGSRVSEKKALSRIGRYVLAPLFILARVFLVVEAFVSLRRVPRAVYQTPEWSEFFPHL
ncbi:hypothetical protein BDV95DRAFT_630407 [Massariosphaeria phaeospora]|uniref:Uncharacterized protein n=1 Tax=Massariosphaeria phaeospora TaxID=100035 RepID=A0A7C8M6D5_9PLEO|nr:hypothetical protein BDV95DRAFT_630407 [Massariosphaeria phaeospora]